MGFNLMDDAIWKLLKESAETRLAYSLQVWRKGRRGLGVGRHLDPRSRPGRVWCRGWLSVRGAPAGRRRTGSCCWSRECQGAADCGGGGASSDLPWTRCSRRPLRPQTRSTAMTRLQKRTSVIMIVIIDCAPGHWNTRRKITGVGWKKVLRDSLVWRGLQLKDQFFLIGGPTA